MRYSVLTTEDGGVIDDVMIANDGDDHLTLVVNAGGKAADVAHLRAGLPPAVSVRHLADAVRRLTAAGCEVVVGTCPDLGTIRPIAQPLRTFARRWSRDLAEAQTVAVVEAGGRTVSLGSVLGPAFASDRSMFSIDEFHPSAVGYAQAAAVLLPSVADAVGVWPTADRGVRPIRRGTVRPVAKAAARAASRTGTEVQPAEVRGSAGPRGPWALLRRRRPTDLPTPEEMEESAETTAVGEAAAPA